jgi:hypothetical protein
MVDLVLSVLSSVLDRLPGHRAVTVRIHQAYFKDGSGPLYFVNVTNGSAKRDVVITHGRSISALERSLGPLLTRFFL